MLFKRVNRENPCPICGKADWCQFGDRAMKCMRVESAHVCEQGGWFHFYTEAKPDFLPKEKQAQPPKIDAYGIMRRWQMDTRNKGGTISIRCCAIGLGVLPQSIIALGAAFAPEYKAWAFPMKDETGNIIGIRLRNMQGFKWAVQGSRSGLFIPDPIVPVQPVLYVCEGPTDAAALLSIGLYAIGRPNCNSGSEMLYRAIRLRREIKRVVIVADNDDLKQMGSGLARPGIVAAQKLKEELRMQSIVVYPPSPCKDIRAVVIKIGMRARAILESEVNKKVWSFK